MADLARARGGLNVFVARDGSRATAFEAAMGFFAPEMEILRLPAWDCLPYDRVGPSATVSAERMATLTRLARGGWGKQPALLLTHAPALMQRLPPKDLVLAAGYSAAVGATVDMAQLERYFAINGYHRASTVSERGEFAVRGGVIDVFPPGADEALLDADAVARFRKGYVAAFGSPGDDPLYAAVSEGARRAGLEHWLPLLYPHMESLFDYLPADALIGLDHLAAAARDDRLAMIADAYEARARAERKAHYRPLPPSALYLSNTEWDQHLAAHPLRRFEPFRQDAAPGVVDLGAKLGRNFAAERAQDSVNLFEAAADHARRLMADGKRVLFASWSDGASERLA